MSNKLAFLAAALLITAACSARADGPPDITVDRTACDHCRMLVSEPRHAAAWQGPGGEARVFDDIGCLLDALRKEERTSNLRYWFHDAGDGAWIQERDVTFVSSPEIRTPMSGGIAAYRDPKAAEAAAQRFAGRIVSWDDLLARKEGGS